MKKVLLIHNGSELYGGSKSLLNITNILCKNNMVVKVLLPSTGPLVTSLTKKNIEVMIVNPMPQISINQLNRFKKIVIFFNEFFHSIKKIKKIINEFSPDIIHTNVSTIASPAIASKLSKVKFIWHVREIYDGKQKFMWKFYQLFIYYFSDIIITNSNATKKQFSGFLQKKVVKLYNCFEFDENKKLLSDKDKYLFKSKYNINSDFCIGMIGRINLNRKGQHIFVEAAKKIKIKFPKIKFVIFGEPYPGNEFYLDKLIKLINNYKLNDYVILVGEVKNINFIYGILDIVVIPSNRPESFGNVASEAMFFAKPVISSNIGGVSEQIFHQKNGLLFENCNSSDLANRIEQLIINEKKRNRFGLAGEKILKEKFNYDLFSKNLLNIYEKL